jgi:hypothetical protein
LIEIKKDANFIEKSLGNQNDDQGTIEIAGYIRISMLSNIRPEF